MNIGEETEHKIDEINVELADATKIMSRHPQNPLMSITRK